MLQPEGVADRHHPLAGAHALGVAQRQGEELLVGFDADQRDVGLGVAAHDLGVVLAAVVEGNLDAVHVLDHVVVGHDVAVGGDHEAGAEARDLARMLLLAEGAAEEELLEAVGHLRPLDRLRGLDVDDAGRDALGEVGEARRDAARDDRLRPGALVPEGLGC
jgi:hypothetical protein